MRQVNVSYSVIEDAVTAWVSDWSSDGYVGRLTDTVYTDGADTTNWCVFHGTQEECDAWIRAHQNDMGKYS